MTAEAATPLVEVTEQRQEPQAIVIVQWTVGFLGKVIEGSSNLNFKVPPPPRQARLSKISG